MPDALTFPAALAACTERWGEPTMTRDGREPKTLPMAQWGDVNSGVVLTDCTGLAVDLSATAHGTTRSWTLAGQPVDGAPLTPLPAALAAVDAWRRERGG